ncbi:hypothetical protein TSTA_039870 [Talaromyces stipitatus ATCC 10500]|uniref:Reverse transcriptase domain-containing protein n=1 Tax=Talaromyces stipitatus (strain ATCC 10500 / CBS 375.48 / QM 6759 / NRRL 1006) TaxID=441959 RepID=B8M450_TALSN|nr:uncharacterized protein TSTA_039870 [Talaromyces stipitatus ATCC 10500]EED20793.1 hypothetical protein TSTA_039870 [Talaromyces stipitatus ATCC 10500]
MTASLLTLDVKGAFDAVLPGRLIRRLRSPVSGILFMLYIAPLFRLGNPRNKFGYADDAANLAISTSLATNCEALSDSLQEALNWGAAEGITFTPDKYELLHFSQRKADQDPTCTPSVKAGSITVSENTKRLYLRWLGILYDKKLTFKWHVSETVSKALTVANALRSLGNTARGVKPYLLQQAVLACVLHKAYYGARVVLLVFRITPISVLYRESGFSPLEIELDRIALLATVRLRRLDPYHPLRRRAEQVASNSRQTSRFARRILALPNSKQINPLQHAPWHPRETRENAQARIGAPMGRSKEQAAADFIAFQRTIPSSDIIIFSDGSRLVDGRAGGGYIGFQAHNQFLRSSLSYKHGKEVFDAEAEAALAGAQAAIAYPTAQFATNLWICLDNLEVATRLLSPSTGSSQEAFESFRTLAAGWPLYERLPHTKSGSV